ncbi:MAG: hypothetical protein ACYTHM_00530 [Planctomycetota bacterium]|jgi:hypothetical protein
MPPHPEDSPSDSELEPIDPKVASRAIKKHIARKRATGLRKREGPEQDSPEKETAQPPSMTPEKEVPPPGAPAPAPAEKEGEMIKGIPIRNRDLVTLMEHSPESLQVEWLQGQAGDDPLQGEPVSRTEMEFLLLKRTLME